MKRSSITLAALCFSAGLALAQTPEKVAEEYFTKGNTSYNLGRFDEAAGFFTKAYEAWPQPEFLYNIAQSYRLGGNCKQALHFYRRFKALKQDINAKKKAEVDKFIKELTACVAKADSTAGQQPDTLDTPPGTGTTGTGTTGTHGATGTGTGTGTPTGTTGTGMGTQTATGTGTAATGTQTAIGTGTAIGGTGSATTGTTAAGTGTGTTGAAGTGATTGTTAALEDPNAEEDVEEDDASVGATATSERPKTITARFGGGIAMLSSGDLEIPVQPAFGIVGGYPLPAGPATIELGAGLSYTPLPYEVMGSQKRGMMLGARAVVGGVYPAAPKLSLRGELGIGIVSLSGLEMGNPISQNRDAKSFTLPSFRFGVSADYEVAPNVVATISPFGIAFSPGADGMYGDSLRAIDILVGVGYRQ